MNNIIPDNSRYIPMTQQKSCCFPTCLLMIMYKHNIPLIPQELLGYHLGLLVSEESSDLFWNAETGEKPEAGYGTRIFLDEYEPNKVFKKLDIPLVLSKKLIEDFESTEAVIDYLENVEKNNLDVLTCFNHQVLKGTGSGGGHLTIFDRVDRENNTVRLVDPSYNQPKWRMAKLSLLVKAMREHKVNHGGFWEIKKV